jgi:rhodanese-related sulfurtransferase
MENLEDAMQSVKETVTSHLPKPPSIRTKSSAKDLKARLEWGEPALTIIDVRDREAFNRKHIMGAISIPPNRLVNQVRFSFDPRRDIYVYGSTSEETAQAVESLRNAGFFNVAELEGGLAAWKAIAGSTEGTDEVLYQPGPEAYNVVSRVSYHLSSQKQGA